MQKHLKTYRLLLNSIMISLKSSGLILIGILCSQYLFSQQPDEMTEEFKGRNLREELYIRTDRDIYFSGEQVWLKVYKLSNLTNAPWDLSKVVYVELLDKNNFPVKQIKVKTEGNSVSSGFMLPENISSGNYAIRAYTNWMKNWPADMFFYMTISVINPFENIDHLELPPQGIFTGNTNNLSGLLPGTVSGTRLPENPGIKGSNNSINFKITLQKPDYSSREKVSVMISATDMEGNPAEADLSVSVAKSAVVNSTTKNITSRLTIQDPVLSETINIHDYLPELEGHLISGYIRLKSNDEPLRKADVSLTFVGKTARCQFSRTDEKGRFNFLIKETGINEIVIQPLSPDLTGYYVELIQPFTSKFGNYKPATFYLDSSKIREINNAVISMQINNIYEPFRQKKPGTEKKKIPDFYGKPENTINMSDYIELTSLREVVKEIIPNVYTLKQNGKYDFKLINKFRGQPFENKPLVLVDGVPIYDFEKVLSINSKDIERADIINTRYFYSENVFDGIVSFITKKGNLSAIEFDNSIFRQVYEACVVQNEFYSPDYSNDSLKNNRIPDYRNTLYWVPDLQTRKDGKTEIGFFTSDESADYTILVEGISSDGKTGSSNVSFSVK